jgi:hypothetical protein
VIEFGKGEQWLFERKNGRCGEHYPPGVVYPQAGFLVGAGNAIASPRSAERHFALPSARAGNSPKQLTSVGADAGTLVNLGAGLRNRNTYLAIYVLDLRRLADRVFIQRDGFHFDLFTAIEDL